MHKRILVVFPLFLSLFLSAQNPESLGMVNEDLPEGIPVGEALPENGTSDMLDSFAFEESEYTVVFFYRGSWCPHCTKYLSGLMDSLQYITARGARVIAITPEIDSAAVADVRAIVGDQLEILLDEEGSYMRWFDVDFKVTEAYQEKLRTRLNTELVENNHQEVAVLPVPATFIFDREGTLIWRHFDMNYRVRATPGMILKGLKN